MARIEKTIDVTVSIDEFSEEDILSAAREICDEFTDLTGDDRDFLRAHFDRMIDESRASRDLSAAARFEFFRNFFR